MFASPILKSIEYFFSNYHILQCRILSRASPFCSWLGLTSGAPTSWVRTICIAMIWSLISWRIRTNDTVVIKSPCCMSSSWLHNKVYILLQYAATYTFANLTLYLNHLIWRVIMVFFCLSFWSTFCSSIQLRWCAWKYTTRNVSVYDKTCVINHAPESMVCDVYMLRHKPWA
jgi:hypothetical protein